MSDITLFKQPTPSVYLTVTLTDEDQLIHPLAVAMYMAEGYRCAECKAPTGHSRSCQHYDGYKMAEFMEHEADGDAVLPKEEE